MLNEAEIDEIEFLTRSPSRVFIIEVLHVDGPLSRTELRDRLDSSRTTSIRNIGALEEHRLIQSGQSGYSLTPCGELIAQGLAAFESYVRAAVQLREVAEWLPSNGFEFDLRALADADITGPSVNDPYGPVNQHVRLVEAADSLKLLLPVLGYEAMRTALDQVQSGSAHEAVVGGNVTDTIQSEPYDALLDELLDTGRSHIYCSDEKIPFYLGIAEDLDLVQIGVIDENRIPRGMIETDDPEVREWAERLFSKYKERARRIE